MRDRSPKSVQVFQRFVRAARRHTALSLVCALCLGLAMATLLVGPRALATAGLPPFQMDTTLPPQIVINRDQGLGQCHWVDPNIISKSYVSWAYDAGLEASGWATIEPQPGVYSWTRLDAEISKARTRGKRIWIELHTTEGATPRWAREAGVPLIGSLQVPAPWDPTYQRLLRRAVHAMAARYDNNPTVDAVVTMAGGCYGEMTICNARTDEAAWVAAGYTDEKFATAVKQIIDIYLEDDYVWEDGTHTHGFRNKPVVLHVGTGLWEHAIVLDPVVGDIVRKYGARVWLKYNGLGDGNLNLERVFREWDTTTRVGYEPVGNSVDFLNRPDYYVQIALNQHSSYLCLQDAYYNIYDETWQAAREMAARYLGAQIVSRGIEAPTSVYPGQTYTFVTHWVNRGTVPLWYARRVGIKGVPTSYHILLSFVNAATGQSVFDYSFVPTLPTQSWYSAQPARIEQGVPIDAYVPAGEYDIRIALIRPGLDPDDPQRYFRLVNTALHDGAGRYTVGRITVQNIGQTPLPTRTPSGTPTRTPTLDPNVTLTATPTRTATVVAATPSRTPTRTPTVVPPGGEITLVLQQGLNDYAGCEDTFIHQYEPDRNTCQGNALEVGYKQRYAALLRFDLSPVPVGSLVNRATLQLYAQGWGGVDTTFEVYRILQPWRACEATWNVAQVGTPWDQAGVNDPVMDRAMWPESSANTAGIWRWYSFDVTALVQDWLNGSAGNHGLLLRGASIRSEGKFYFASAQGASLAYRPMLMIAYRAGVATPTATPTGTSVATPSATPTRTATPASSVTVLPTATATRTPTSTTSATPTRTATVTPTRTAFAPPPGTEVTVTLQQGLDGYAGCEDTFIHQYEPDRNTCHDNALEVGYKQRYAALLRFDLAPIPAGSVVSRAIVQLYAQGWGGAGTTLELYRVLRPWRVCEATWNAAQAGVAWSLPGVNNTATDRAALPESSVKADSVWRWYSFDVTALVQDWVGGSAVNNGMFLRGAPAHSEGKFYLSSAQGYSASYRPKLVITYKVGLPTATPTSTTVAAQTATPTRTPTLSSSATVVATATNTPTRTIVPPPPGAEVIVTLQQGLDDYAGCDDTFMHQYEPDRNTCYAGSLDVGYKQRYAALLRFDLASIPAGSLVSRATLQLYAQGWGGVDTTLELYRVLRPWRVCEATWNVAQIGKPWGLPGVNDVLTDRAATPESTVSTSGIWKWYTFDVTALVQGWVDGSVANNGVFLCGASSRSDGKFYFSSSQGGSVSYRPKLVITYR